MTKTTIYDFFVKYFTRVLQRYFAQTPERLPNFMLKPARFINQATIVSFDHIIMKANLAILIFLLVQFQNLHAQSGLKLPADNPEKAKENYAMLSDYHDSENAKEYEIAYQSLHWIMENAPDLHESIYIFGVKLLKTKIEREPETPGLKDELMDLYDTRINYFGNELQVLDRKAYDAFQYLRKDSSRIDEIVNLFDYLYLKEKNDFASNLIYPYFILKISQLNAGKITDRGLIENYQNICEIIESKSPDSNMDKIQKLIDAHLLKNIKISCDSIGDLLVLEDKSKTMNHRQAELVIKLSLTFECTDMPIFVEAIKVLYEEKPTFKLAKLIGGYYLGKDEINVAIDYLTQAIELVENQVQKSEVYFDLAKTYLIAKNYMKAREMAQLSLKYNSDNPDCYKLIGDMYYNSFDACKKGKSHVEDRSIFYAAFEKYAKAGDSVKMANAEQQFPTMEQIHTENYEENQIINTGCWVNEQVKIRRRPSLAIR